MVARHLQRVCGRSLAPRELSRMVDAAFASYGRYWAESLRLPSVSQKTVLRDMAYEGYEHIHGGREAGRGTILALPHLGGWEWAGTQLALVGHPISVVVERLEPPSLFDWFVRLRARLGMNVIPVGPSAVAQCTRALRSNHLLCLLCDRVVGGTAGVEVEFFGERTQLPAGPLTLSLRTGATLLPCAVYFDTGGSPHLGAVSPPLRVDRTGSLREDVQAGTRMLAEEMERFIRRAPTQWHLMQPNWPSDLLSAGGPASTRNE